MTTDTPEPTSKTTLDDCRRATVALTHWMTGDLTGLQEVLDPIETDPERLAATLVSLLQLVPALIPDDRRRLTVEHLRTITARVVLTGDVDRFPYTEG